MTSAAAAIPEKKTAVRPFGLRDKIGYMFGDFGNDFTFLLQSSFFMIFYTNVMGISAAHVGTLLRARAAASSPGCCGSCSPSPGPPS